MVNRQERCHFLELNKNPFWVNNMGIDLQQNGHRMPSLCGYIHWLRAIFESVANGGMAGSVGFPVGHSSLFQHLAPSVSVILMVDLLPIFAGKYQAIGVWLHGCSTIGKHGR
jgi:hypothetical protein